MNRRAQLLSLAVLLVIAAALRFYLAAYAHAPTLDTAVVGQMARDILVGDRPLFFAGQNYMGALEAYVLAAFFTVFPPGPVTMTFATVLFALSWVVVTFLFFRRTHGPLAALAAATIPAVPGWSTAWYTTAPYGGYPETYTFGMLLLLLSLRFFSGEATRPSPGHAVLFAVIVALGVWTNLQIMPYLGAASLALLLAFYRHPKPLRPWLPYLAIPLAAALALLPQAFAEPSHVHPPMFDHLSLGAAAHSWRALWTHDLKHVLVWTFAPHELHRVVAVLWGLLFTGGFALALQKPRRLHAAWLTAGMILLFAVTYFPHPMSGFVPRYLIGPVTLLASWSIATWLTATPRTLRVIGAGIASLLLFYNATGMITAARARQATTEQTLTAFRATNAAARKADWPTLMITGSETEGYDGARFTFLADGVPVVVSAFSDRFLRHQLAWEFSDQPNYVSTRGHHPFVLGSFAAINHAPGRIIDHPPYLLTANPPVARLNETSILPAVIEGHHGPVTSHPLFDRNETTAWPTTPSTAAQRIEARLREPSLLCGLRVRAPSAKELPYRYTLDIQTDDGTWKTVQHSDRRIAASYISGNQLYFRGDHAWMDIRFPPVRAIAWAWTIQPGPHNPTPPRVSDLHLLATDGTPWPTLDAPLAALLDALREETPSPLLAERGLLRLLHRHSAQHATYSDLKPLLPLPYNPRFASTCPPRQPLGAAPYTILLETAYLPEMLTLLQRHAIAPTTLQEHAPFALLRFEVPAKQAGQLAWHGFDLQATTPDEGD